MMNGDRRLLELAAQAAGLMFDPTVRHRDGLLVVRPGARCQSDQMLWNPLNDDGQAFRLAVQLGIEIGWYDRLGYATARALTGRRKHEEYGTDPYAATRRAIVRAAAAIGEALT